MKPSTLPIRLSCPVFNTNGTCTTCPSKRFTRPGDCSLESAVVGIVEVYNNETGQWYPLSGTEWNARARRVVCGELGYPVALKTPPLAELWPNYNGSLLASCNDSNSAWCDPRAIAENDIYRQQLGRTLLRGLNCTGSETRLRDCYYEGIGPYDSTEINVAIVRCGFVPHWSCLSQSSEVRLVLGIRISIYTCIYK